LGDGADAARGEMSSYGGETGPAAPRLLGVPSSARPAALAAARRAGERGAMLDKGAAPWAAAARISPRMTAVFGAIFGLATITTVIALLIQSVPPRDDREAVADAMGSAAPSGSSSAAPASTAQRPKPAKRVRTKVPGPWRLADLASDGNIRIVTQDMERRAFLTALDEAGVDKSQSYRILKAFDGLRKFDKMARKDRFSVAIDKTTKAVKAFELTVSPLEVWQARQSDQGLLVGARLDMQVASEEVIGSFYLTKSMSRSIEWSSFEPGIDKAIDTAVDGHTGTDELAEGATVRVIATEKTALGEFAGYENVIAAELRPADPAKPPFRIYSFTGTKSKGYFDERGRQPDGQGWVHPVPGAPITSKFNPKRLNPVLKKVMPHNGTDYGAPTGTPIYAVFRGTVSWVGPRGPAGNLITIDHPNGMQTLYFHQSRFAEGMKVGLKVATNQLIGYVGTTGRSTGPHLHFGIKRADGTYFDWQTLKIASFRVVDVDDREAFLRRKGELDARLDGIALPEPPPIEAPAKADGSGEGDRKPGDEEGGAGKPGDKKAGGKKSDDPDLGDGGPGSDGPGDAPAKKDAKTAKPAGSAKADSMPDGDLEDLMGPDLR